MEYVRRVCEHAADMGDGSSAHLICAFWTETKEAMNTDQLIRAAFEQEETTEDDNVAKELNALRALAGKETEKKTLQKKKAKTKQKKEPTQKKKKNK